MQRVRWTVATLVLLAASSTVPSAPGVLARGEGALPLERLVELLGGAPPAEVRVATYRADGPSERVLPWAEFEAAWPRPSPRTEGTGAGPAHAVCSLAPGTYCPDAGYSSSSLPFCDATLAWVLHGGTPGAAFTVRDPGGPGPIRCGGFYGQSVQWNVLELSATKVPEVLTALEGAGCYAEVWVVHGSGFCPYSSFGTAPAPTTPFLLHLRARGPGVAVSLSAAGVTLDYFLGGAGYSSGAVVCYDLPPKALYFGVQCA